MVQQLPFNQAYAISKSDTVNFPQGPCAAIYVGVTGIVVAVLEDDSAVTFKGVPAGAMLPVKAKRVNSTTTTATDMVALYTI